MPLPILSVMFDGRCYISVKTAMFSSFDSLMHKVIITLKKIISPSRY